jgi:hypothetical protein
MELALVMRVDTVRAPLLLGEARRDSVLRKILRLMGWAAESMGNLGSLVPGTESASLTCNSTTSVAVRVSVRLCVEAAKEGISLAGSFVKDVLRELTGYQTMGGNHMAL